MENNKTSSVLIKVQEAKKDSKVATGTLKHPEDIPIITNFAKGTLQADLNEAKNYTDLKSNILLTHIDKLREENNDFKQELTILREKIKELQTKLNDLIQNEEI